MAGPPAVCEGMFMRHRVVECVLALTLAACLPARGSLPDGPSAERGRDALETRCFSAPFVSRAGYDTLWKQWGLAERPADFDAQVRTRYGLHEAPYPNDGLPMGLRMREKDARATVGIDCMLC